MEKYIHEVKHFWNEHRKVVIVAGIILAVAVIL